MPVAKRTTRRPPVPTPAERARTIAARGGRAALLPSREDPDPARAQRVAPLLHHVHSDASVSMLLPDEHPVVAAGWHSPRREVGTMLELADPAPVRLREPVRGLLWVTGRLQVLEPEQAHEAAVALSEPRPDPRLLDVGHGVSVLRLHPVTLVLADAEGSCSLSLDAFATARPDPFCLLEDEWLRHLDLSHRDVVGLLSAQLPKELHGGHIRPLGMDRFGVRLRVESPDDDHDVRLAFSRPVTTTEEVGVELRKLVGCPFLNRMRA